MPIQASPREFEIRLPLAICTEWHSIACLGVPIQIPALQQHRMTSSPIRCQPNACIFAFDEDVANYTVCARRYIISPVA